MTDVPSGTPAPRQRARRERSVTESLLSIVLVLESVLVFFVTLVVFGTEALPAGLAFGGGAALILALALTGGVLRYSWGIWIGWILQAALLATGLLVSLMYFIALCFIAIWVYCFVRGRQIDRQKAAFAADQHPQGDPS